VILEFDHRDRITAESISLLLLSAQGKCQQEIGGTTQQHSLLNIDKYSSDSMSILKDSKSNRIDNDLVDYVLK